MLTYSRKLKLIWLLSAIISIYWLSTTTLPWYSILGLFYISVFISRIGSEAAFHRYFTHRAFKTNKVMHYVLLWWGTLLGVGSCISWSCMHRAHHATSDTDDDPHSPHKLGYLRTFFLSPDVSKLTFKNVSDLVRDPAQNFCHRNYFKIVLTWIAFLGILSYWSMLPLVTLFAMPVCILWIMTGITNCLAHSVGYRNFETSDKSTNHHLTRWLLLNVGLHNNHHYKPTLIDYNIKQRWYEFDLESYFIKLIKT